MVYTNNLIHNGHKRPGWLKECYLVVNPIKKNLRPGSCRVPIRTVNGIHADVIDDIIANY
jgi:hypothetical protein